MKIEDVYELNELNVKKFTKYVKARPEDDKKSLRLVYAYIDENGKIDPRTKLYFSDERYEQQRDRILSMLGQLKKIHDLSSNYNKYNFMLDFIDLQTKYDGTRWTEDPNCTLFLFWLGNAGEYFTGLEKNNDGIYRTDLRDAINTIYPMESPSDPYLTKRFPVEQLRRANELEKAAESGDANAQYQVGMGNLNGWIGFRKNHAWAVYWFEKAAEQGHAKAQYETGRWSRDDARAAYWYEKAAKQGHGEAQSRLAYRYAKGIGGPKNMDKAMYWYEKWAENKDTDFYVENLHYVGRLYDEGINDISVNKFKAAEWFEKAAVEGHTESQSKLVDMYYNGDGIPVNKAKAAYWLEKLAEKGYAVAQYNLGVMYYNGDGISRNRLKAKEFIQKAAAQGYEDAKSALKKIS